MQNGANSTENGNENAFKNVDADTRNGRNKGIKRCADLPIIQSQVKHMSD
jgi:hypothetical protein